MRIGSNSTTFSSRHVRNSPIDGSISTTEEEEVAKYLADIVGAIELEFNCGDAGTSILFEREAMLDMRDTLVPSLVQHPQQQFLQTFFPIVASFW